MEEKKFYTCRYDIAFKEIFMKEKNKDILIALIESILNIKIKEITYLNLEKNNGNVYIRRKHFDFHVKTEHENIHIEVNNYLEDYVRPRNMAFICNTYSKEVLRGEEYNENIEFFQINLTYKMMNEYKEKNKFHDEERIRIYKIRDDTGKNFVNNFTIYELNMDYYLNLWYSKNEKEIDKYKYLIMLDLEEDDLIKLSKRDKVINKYMEEVKKINEDPEFYEYISAEEDNRKIENSIKTQYTNEGRKENSIEVAKNLKIMGLDKYKIAKATNLSIEEIDNIDVEVDYEYISAEEDNRKIENSIKAQYTNEGRKENSIEIARRMKENGMNISLIKTYTDLSVEEIERLWNRRFNLFLVKSDDFLW